MKNPSKKSVRINFEKMNKALEEALKNPQPYTKEFWDKVQESIKRENEEYEKRCKRMNIDPRTGYTIITSELLNKRFTI